MSVYGAAEFARDCAVSRETAERLETYRALLAEWSKRFDLIGPNELDRFWPRHALDSAQLVSFAPNAKRWADLGTGAGFPGLVIACVLAETPGAEVSLVESSTKKADFLNTVIKATNAPAKVFPVRIEDFNKADRSRYDVVTARALAPLMRLIEHAKPILDRGAQGLFLKGSSFEAELAAASKALGAGGFKADVLESRSDPRGRVIRITAQR
ncbi:MAG TPA: 16S rRNA (guanine(527)-N(7))-methyltransferase RsmG [Caulobacterales bacterium]|nr:16S rRNA (guanine(527)-N(7))-methyltransferase RsmG [Caulobacterales bacterium]